MAKRIYISGKITGNDRYLSDFQSGAALLERADYIPINPAAVTLPLAKVGAGFTNEDYMDICLEVLAHCDGILMLHNWRESEGAREELDVVLRKYPDYEIIFEHELGGSRD